MNVNWDSIASWISDFFSYFFDFVPEPKISLSVLFMIVIFICYCFYNKKIINDLSEKKLEEFKRNGKYNPLLFVELSNAKELLRYFIIGTQWKKRIIVEFNRICRGNNILRKYNKHLIKTRKICYFSSLKKIKKSITTLISYFSNNESLDEYKYHIEMQSYVYKNILEDILQKCNIMQSNIVLIKSSAGNGKTALACNTTELLLNLGKRVIFINSRDVVIFSEKSFREYLINRIGLFPLLAKFKDIVYSVFFQHFQTYIVIDAINENDEKDFPRQLFLELDELASKGVKIILTCRDEYFEERFSNFIADMSNRPYILEITKWNNFGAKEKILERYGIHHNSCIDGKLIEKLSEKRKTLSGFKEQEE